MSLRRLSFALVAIPAFACGSEPAPASPEPSAAKPAPAAPTPAPKPAWSGAGTQSSPYVATCSNSGKDLEGAVGDSFFVECPSGCTSGGVWGSGPYTRDSRICPAAVHAGAVPSTGGLVVASIDPGQSDYPSTEANGITSSKWSSYDTSLGVAAPKTTSTRAGTTKKTRTAPKHKGRKRGR